MTSVYTYVVGRPTPGALLGQPLHVPEAEPSVIWTFLKVEAAPGLSPSPSPPPAVTESSHPRLPGGGGPHPLCSEPSPQPAPGLLASPVPTPTPLKLSRHCPGWRLRCLPIVQEIKTEPSYLCLGMGEDQPSPTGGEPRREMLRPRGHAQLSWEKMLPLQELDLIECLLLSPPRDAPYRPRPWGLSP